MSMLRFGNKFHYWTVDLMTMPDGLYHVGEGWLGGWTLRRGFKTINGARRYAIRQAGTDTFTD